MYTRKPTKGTASSLFSDADMKRIQMTNLFIYLKKSPMNFKFTLTMRLISCFASVFVFIASLFGVHRGKVARERGIMVWSRLVLDLIWKIHELSCLENNKTVAQRINVM